MAAADLGDLLLAKAETMVEVVVFEEVVLESLGCCVMVDVILVTVFAGIFDCFDGIAGSLNVKIEADASDVFVDVKGVVGTGL